MSRKISFIGVGNMASAIISGITSREKDPILWSDIILCDKNIEKVAHFIDKGAFIAKDIKQAVEMSDCILLCVKPQNFSDVLPQLSNISSVDEKLFITIAAGISMNDVSIAANGAAVVRAMPNTPMLIGCGVSALCKNEKVSDEDFEFACKIFSSAGKVIKIKEDEMNRIICVSGSSPAYVFMMIKAMFDGAVEQGLLKSENTDSGLSEKELIDAICDTIIGSAKLMKSRNITPLEQIKVVCSKGGTTEQAVWELEKNGFYEAFSNAMMKCTERADELSMLNK